MSGRSPAPTYNAQAKEYRSWYFDGHGLFPRAANRGTWDAKTKTITWTATDDNGQTSVSKGTIVDNDTVNWSLTITDADGTVLFDSRGKGTRRKE